ncbi:MAG: hypothetical protein ACFFAN_02460 [Promethearchaeota archaeon]
MSEPPSESALFRKHLVFGIVFIFLGFVCTGVSALPFNDPLTGLTYFIIGIIFLIGGIINIIIYVTKPEYFRNQYLKKWEKKQAK